MAYIYDQVTTTFATAASVEVPLSDHDEGDLLMLCCSQDGGGTTIASSDWTLVGTQAASGSCRQVWLYKYAGASEANPTVTGANDEWVVTAMAIKDAASSSPIDISARANWNATNTAVAPTVTTTTDNCLVLRSWVSDSPGGDERLTAPADTLLCDVKETNQIIHVIGHEVAFGAGATGTKTAYSEVAIEGGNAWTIAIKNATGGSVDHSLSDGWKRIAWYGKFGVEHDSLTWAAMRTVAATINGISTSSTAAVESFPTSLPDPPIWGYWTSLANTLIEDAITGAVHGISSTDFTNRQFHVRLGFSSNVDLQGATGACVVFVDGSGNWEVHQLLPYPNRLFVGSTTYAFTIQPDSLVPLDSSGTIDWSNITKLGYLWHRVSASSTNSRGLWIRDAYLSDMPVVVGGGANKPLTFDAIEKAINGWFDAPTKKSERATLQGAGQLLASSGFQLGDGTNKTYVDTTGAAFEFPLPFSTRRNRRLWNVPEGKVSIAVHASANDTIRLRSAILSSASRQRFELASGSSTLATYDFSGLVVSGFEVTWRDGITCNEAGFVGCYKITTNGGTFDGCVIDSSLDAIALTTSDPGEIVDCQFISGGSGHAIEITTPGTYTFSGNLFSGYGSAGTADAAIYNNSGGAVTLNLSGGDTPTVTNGAGATTSLVASATIEVTNLATGTRVLVTRDDTSAVLFNGTETAGEISFGTSYTGDFTVVARKASATPYYREWFAQGTAVSGQTTSFKAQQRLDE